MEITYHRLKYSSLLWVLLGFGIFVVVGFYSARMTHDYPGYDAGRAQDRKATLAKVQHDENALLYPTDKDGKPTATWVDQDKGLISIPIDEAMAHEVDDLAKVTVGQGAPIPGVAPAPAAAPAPPPPASPVATAGTPDKTVTPTTPPKAKKKKPAQTPPPAHA